MHGRDRARLEGLWPDLEQQSLVAPVELEDEPSLPLQGEGLAAKKELGFAEMRGLRHLRQGQGDSAQSGEISQGLPRRALGEDALQGSPVHIEAPRGLGNVVAA